MHFKQHSATRIHLTEEDIYWWYLVGRSCRQELSATKLGNQLPAFSQRKRLLQMNPTHRVWWSSLLKNRNRCSALKSSGRELFNVAKQMNC